MVLEATRTEYSTKEILKIERGQKKINCKTCFVVVDGKALKDYSSALKRGEDVRPYCNKHANGIYKSSDSNSQ